MDTSKYITETFDKPIKVSYNRRDLILYAIGIGSKDLRYTYEDYEDDFQAFPTYPIVLSFKGTDQDVVSFPSPAMIEAGSFPPLPGTKVGLDGERYIEKVEAIDPDGSELLLKSRVIGIHKRGSGALVEQESLLTDTSGRVKYKMVSGSFLVGAKGFKDSGTSMSRKVPVPNRSPDKVVDEPTLPNQTHLYRLSGDYNALHIDKSFAKMSGFGKPILHGLCTMGFSARAVLNAYGEGNGENFKALKVRFASPVLPGQTLRVNMWKEGNRVYFTTSVKETGKVVINNSYMDLVSKNRL